MLLLLCLLLSTTAAQLYDYVIVGAGTSGLLLAVALTSNPNVSVVVLEAGEDSRTDPRVTVPENHGSIQGTQYDWQFTTVPQTGLFNSPTRNAARGKTIGGTSAMNWMIWNRASAIEYNAYQNVLHIPGWNWSTISEASKQSEKFFPPPTASSSLFTYNTAYHGNTGPIHGTMPKSLWSMFSAYLVPALKSLDVKIPRDRDGGDTHGAGVVPLAIDLGSYTRSYAGSAYTAVQNRSNLKMVTNATVSRILWGTPKSGSQVATGLEYYRSVGNRRVKSSVDAKQVLLSAGGIQTPQLLELSGIGDPSILKSKNVKTIVNLPAVGTKLQDPLSSVGSFSFNKTGFTGGSFAQDFIDMAPPSRFLSSSDHEAAAKMLNAGAPLGTSSTTFAMVKYLFEKDEPLIEFGWYLNAVNVYLLHPLSEGTVHITSADPFASPAIDPRYNTAKINGTPWDLWLSAKAHQWLATALQNAGPFSSIAAKYSINSSLPYQDFEDIVYQKLGSSQHFSGGAVMLPKASGGVVDQKFLVYGTSNVRVVDSSIIPVSPGQHPMGLAYAIAMRAFQLLS